MSRALLIGLAIALGLAACGKQGDLERPGPLWGDKAKANWAAQQQKAAAQKATASQANQIEPLPDDNAAANAAAQP
jgi:predicted small lipoprotein YifL